MINNWFYQILLDVAEPDLFPMLTKAQTNEGMDREKKTNWDRPIED